MPISSAFPSSLKATAKSSAAEAVPPSTSTAIGTLMLVAESVSMSVFLTPFAYSAVAATHAGSSLLSIDLSGAIDPPPFCRTSRMSELSPELVSELNAPANCSAVLSLNEVIFI